jgi:dTDP-4-dehydrorhamnose 3,5-epimerase-like enzyme
MSLERPSSTLPGVRFGAVARMADTRGAFRELWRADAFGAIEPGDAGADPSTTPTFVQANLSTSAPGVLRGLHYHRRQLDYWVVTAGRAFVALVDLRPALRGSAGAPAVETRELQDDWVVSGRRRPGFLALGARDAVP